MRMSVELILNRSRDEVWRAFDNAANMTKWQPTLKSFEPQSGTPGQVGAVSKLTYDENGRQVVLTETVTLRRQPEVLAGTYDSGMAVNTIHNAFTELTPATTKWVMDCEFRFRGFFR